MPTSNPVRCTYVGDDPSIRGKRGTFTPGDRPVAEDCGVDAAGTFTPDADDGTPGGQGYDAYTDEVIYDGERCPRGGFYDDDAASLEAYSEDFEAYALELLASDGLEGDELPSDLF